MASWLVIMTFQMLFDLKILKIIILLLLLLMMMIVMSTSTMMMMMIALKLMELMTLWLM